MTGHPKTSCLLMLAVLALAVIAQAAAPPPPDPAPDPNGPPNIFYGAVAPYGEKGPVVVFLHGLGSQAQYWWTSNATYQMAYAMLYRTAFISFNADSSQNTASIAQNAATFKTL